MLEACDVREVELQEVRCRDKDHTTNQRGQENSARNGAFCIFGLFRQRTDAIKAEEREAEYRRTGNHRHHMRILRPEWTAAHRGNPDHDNHLQHHNHTVEVGDGFDALEVRERHKPDQQHHKNPRRDARHQRFEIVFSQQDVDHRHEQVVQQ